MTDTFFFTDYSVSNSWSTRWDGNEEEEGRRRRGGGGGGEEEEGGRSGENNRGRRTPSTQEWCDDALRWPHVCAWPRPSAARHRHLRHPTCARSLARAPQSPVACRRVQNPGATVGQAWGPGVSGADGGTGGVSVGLMEGQGSGRRAIGKQTNTHTQNSEGRQGSDKRGI
jgi:hypothetical protein